METTYLKKNVSSLYYRFFIYVIIKYTIMSKTRWKNEERKVKTIYFELKFLIIYEELLTL